jgi:hypothetical protein
MVPAAGYTSVAQLSLISSRTWARQVPPPSPPAKKQLHFQLTRNPHLRIPFSPAIRFRQHPLDAASEQPPSAGLPLNVKYLLDLLPCTGRWCPEGCGGGGGCAEKFHREIQWISSTCNNLYRPEITYKTQTQYPGMVLSDSKKVTPFITLYLCHHLSKIYKIGWSENQHSLP